MAIPPENLLSIKVNIISHLSMNLDRILILIIFLSVALRYLWAILGWSGEFFMLFPVFIFLFILLLVYYRGIQDGFYKLVILYFMLFIGGLVMNVLGWKGKGMMLFLGSLGFILFSGYFMYQKSKDIGKRIFKWSLFLGMVLLAQTFIFLFIGTDKLFLLGHFMSYPLVFIGLAILFGKRMGQDISMDEKKILSFIIIVSILSAIGVTYKEIFYSSIWI